VTGLRIAVHGMRISPGINSLSPGTGSTEIRETAGAANAAGRRAACSTALLITALLVLPSSYGTAWAVLLAPGCASTPLRRGQLRRRPFRRGPGASQPVVRRCPSRAGAAAGISRRCRQPGAPAGVAGCVCGSFPENRHVHLEFACESHFAPYFGRLCASRPGRPGQRKLANDCRFRRPGQARPCDDREPTNPDQWTSYRPCTGTL
jgi:hypothetical protein